MLQYSGSAITHSRWDVSVLELHLEYWIVLGTTELLCVECILPDRIFPTGVPGFATDCPCGVWCRGLTTCFLYVSPPFANMFLYDSRSVKLV